MNPQERLTLLGTRIRKYDIGEDELLRELGKLQNAQCHRQIEPALATLGGYLNYQHQVLPPTRPVIVRPRAHCDPSHAPSASPKSP